MAHAQGFCYVYYANAEGAAAALERLNGVEFPPHSGHRLKVRWTSVAAYFGLADFVFSMPLRLH